jgi:hypothetical protein
MLKSSQSDFETLQLIIKADVPMTESLMGTIAKWFGNVEIGYPIAEMELTAAERSALAITVMKEMCDVTASAVTALEADGDDEEVLADISPKLDALWRELTGLFAVVLNESFHRSIENVDPDEVREALESAITTLAEVVGEDEDEVREMMKSDESFRAKVRRMGIDPDSI